nr:hypothetical protein Iba_chr04eCG18430 [Ipomoea batatas]
MLVSSLSCALCLESLDGKFAASVANNCPRFEDSHYPLITGNWNGCKYWRFGGNGAMEDWRLECWTAGGLEAGWMPGSVMLPADLEIWNCE